MEKRLNRGGGVRSNLWGRRRDTGGGWWAEEEKSKTSTQLTK